MSPGITQTNSPFLSPRSLQQADGIGLLDVLFHRDCSLNHVLPQRVMTGYLPTICSLSGNHLMEILPQRLILAKHKATFLATGEESLVSVQYQAACFIIACAPDTG